MGANAQTTVPTFVASQVLTADQQNQSARTGVPVFASTGDRDAAFGGTGEKTLAEGQLCYVEGTGLQTYNAAGSWVTWGAAPTAGGLVPVAAETTFSAVASVAIDNIFTATYTNYLVNIRYTTSTATDYTFKLRVGGVSASTNYNWEILIADGATVSSGRVTAGTSFPAGGNTNGTFYSHTQLTLFSPAVAEATGILHLNNQNAGAYTNPVNKYVTGNHSTATAYDGLELLIASGTISGSYTVYGYRKTI